MPYLKKETEKYSEAKGLSNISDKAEESSNDIELYPNPAGLQLFFTNSDRISKVNILSSQLQYYDVSLIESGLDISQLSNGLWYCELILKDGNKIYKKLIKN